MKRATAAQLEYVKLVTEGGMKHYEAAKIAYPNAKDHYQAARSADVSSNVKMLVARWEIAQMAMGASGMSFALLKAIVTNQLYDYIEQEDGTLKKVHVPCTVSQRIAATKELHGSFGFGRIKAKEGEDPFAQGDMSEKDLEEFIDVSGKEIADIEGTEYGATIEADSTVDTIDTDLPPLLENI